MGKGEIDSLLGTYLDPAFRRRANLILSSLEIAPGMKILDLGCGRGKYENILTSMHARLEIVGVDLDEQRLRYIQESTRSLEVELVRADATCLPFRGSCFDRIIASEIIEHVDDDGKALQEIARVLDHGYVAISVPNASYPFSWDPPNYVLERFSRSHVPSSLGLVAGHWASHSRLYDDRDLRAKTSKSGLRVLSVWRSTRFCLPFISHLLNLGAAILDKHDSPGLEAIRQPSRRPASSFIRLLRMPIDLVDRLNTPFQKDGPSVNIVAKAIRFGDVSTNSRLLECASHDVLDTKSS
jgi:ubiquinone/menaquinone biosynthesis C-methylase UbiE